MVNFWISDITNFTFSVHTVKCSAWDAQLSCAKSFCQGGPFGPTPSAAKAHGSDLKFQLKRGSYGPQVYIWSNLHGEMWVSFKSWRTVSKTIVVSWLGWFFGVPTWLGKPPSHDSPVELLGPPNVISWFITPSNISNYGYNYHKP